MSRVLFFTLLLTFGVNALAFDQQSLMRVFFSVVLVRGYHADGGLAYGSGVVVGENKIVTNCHVLRHTDRAWVSQGEETYMIESVQADPHHDLCLLNFDRLPLRPVEIAGTRDLVRGQEVIAIGHSNGLPAPITSGGQIKSLYPFDGAHVVRTNARFAMGASGSPLFDGEGRLIGINTFKTPGRNAYFYAMPTEWIAALEQQPKQTKLPIRGQAFWEQEDNLKPYFMQVAIPHLNEQWHELLNIGERWVAAEPDNAEAWYELGSAHEGLGQMTEAKQAYQTAVRFAPLHAAALYRLGLLAAQRGDREEMHQVSLTLTKIDGELAANFHKAVGCAGSC